MPEPTPYNPLTEVARRLAEQAVASLKPQPRETQQEELKRLGVRNGPYMTRTESMVYDEIGQIDVSLPILRLAPLDTKISTSKELKEMGIVDDAIPKIIAAQKQLRENVDIMFELSSSSGPLPEAMLKKATAISAGRGGVYEKARNALEGDPNAVKPETRDTLGQMLLANNAEVFDNSGEIRGSFSSQDKLCKAIANTIAKSFGSVQTTYAQTAHGNLSGRIAVNTNGNGIASNISIANHDAKGPVVLSNDGENFTIKIPGQTYSTATIDVPAMLARSEEKDVPLEMGPSTKTTGPIVAPLDPSTSSVIDVNLPRGGTLDITCWRLAKEPALISVTGGGESIIRMGDNHNALVRLGQGDQVVEMPVRFVHGRPVKIKNGEIDVYVVDTDDEGKTYDYTLGREWAFEVAGVTYRYTDDHITGKNNPLQMPNFSRKKGESEFIYDYSKFSRKQLQQVVLDKYKDMLPKLVADNKTLRLVSDDGNKVDIPLIKDGEFVYTDAAGLQKALAQAKKTLEEKDKGAALNTPPGTPSPLPTGGMTR